MRPLRAIPDKNLDPAGTTTTMAKDHRRFAVVGKRGHFTAATLLGLFAMSGSAEARTAGESQRAAAPAGSNRCPGERELTEVKRQARDELDRLEKALGM